MLERASGLQPSLLRVPTIMPKKKQEPEKFGEFLERRNFSRAARACKADEELLLRGFERWLAEKAPKLGKEFFSSPHSPRSDAIVTDSLLQEWSCYVTRFAKKKTMKW